jgi:CRP-like cAMP-binding protein
MIMKRLIKASLLGIAILAVSHATAMTYELQLQKQNSIHSGLLGVVAPGSHPKQTFAQIPPGSCWLISDPSRIATAGTIIGMAIVVVFPRVMRRPPFAATWTGTQPSPLPATQENTAKTRLGLSSADLPTIKLFETFEAAQLEAFCNYVEVVKCPQFSHLIRKGEHGEATYLVLEGEVRALTIIEGRESVPTTFSAGQWFGEISLLDGGPREADFIANRDSVLLKLSSGAFERMRREAPLVAGQFALGLACALAGRMRCTINRFEAALNFIHTSVSTELNQQAESPIKPLSREERSFVSRPHPHAVIRQLPVSVVSQPA